MDVRIGVTYSAKELDIELADDADTEKLKAEIQAALADGKMVWIDRQAGQAGGCPG